MRGFFWLILVLGCLALGLGYLAHGAYPPEPHTQPIQKLLPNDRFQPKS